MDLLYLPDSITFQSRFYSNGNEDQPWVNINDNTVKQAKKERSECNRDPRNCSICKSRQKRKLSTYIMKTRRDSDKDPLHEEEEDENEETNTNENQKQDVKSREKPSK